MTGAVLLGLVLATLAVLDLLDFARRGEWKAAVLSTVLWAVGISAVVLKGAGVELPSLARWIVDLTRPVSSWIP